MHLGRGLEHPGAVLDPVEDGDLHPPDGGVDLEGDERLEVAALVEPDDVGGAGGGDAQLLHLDSTTASVRQPP